mmetsp:Transcript_25841/g.101972  ORF Transcript_25841/g.101972 Transcript_25841/m.101972 type:complete len:92 (+) Transcript_25841:179-454(+)|eukprot:CAMPEP_0113971528 /NCGR_PEP_ID=MMETSP0011_2-20120614/12356_1 /TAXON_ID=101924 /ORGANISM="Rhodosorus marinus" /LENGTH=91 /DNA_ID=CAMNT_0000987173 /DNA_START=114 /DNA_END=389 /DNA_ORIENTATION=- /assembly_acc=CAM_ASM_000156
MGLEDAFNFAAERVKEETSMSNENQLALYSNFKQAKFGDCNTQRPGGLLAMKDKAKWDAWNEKKGVSKEQAMRDYIAKVDAICGTNIASTV